MAIFKTMKVLFAGEESQTCTIAFRKEGHEAFDLNIFDASFTKSIISVAGHVITEDEFEEQRVNILKQAKIILNK